ncbi:hypothetical protein [Mucilaginibacter sp.]|uniref:hypothetical protein n=1 Tax=Mucilaginibacter sp. TaxID=1882438 RepID=UPI0026231A43|nr:hypothetical protein [Mucilaginibacter sp.]MDB4924607.1 hypothetical protein [Mucilaginibacter sp.]
MKKLQLLIWLLCISIYTYAQTDTARKNSKAIFVNAGAQYISNLTYAGRKDVSSVPVLLPSVTLISKVGFFLNSSGYFDISGNNSQTEGLSVTPGYVFTFDKSKHAGGAVSATKYFITNSSPIILSSFNASFDGQLYVNPNDVVKLTLAASYRLDKNNAHDIINDAELTKEIQLIKITDNHKNGFKAAPTLTIYSGTQTFNQIYYTNSQVPQEVDRATTTPGSSQGSVLGFLFPPGTPSQTISKTIVNQTVTEEKQREVRKYQLLAVSAAMPLTYTIKKIQFVGTPYFVKPINQVNYLDNSSMNGIYFWFTVGANVTF